MTFPVSMPGGMMALRAAAHRPPAPPAPPMSGETIVGRLDADGDGQISATEVGESKAGAKVDEALFAKIDGDSDGLLSAGELDAFAQTADFEADMGRGDGPGRLHPIAVAAGALLLSIFQNRNVTEEPAPTPTNAPEAGDSETQEVFGTVG
ncbi:EF-hand domain-containing protein [Flavimaricola marinus]|uniref:EF-hand domain-containing protein n=1 Tax=Flavimaricola marinus TaxID=1819565 RepID=A0A238LG72_9RHOB|nr:EF-hand domain-containing protein [Flavimaricola marinus]SMY08717.1 hypothetical protein LOM8899_02873 [Flavimaricola marinus]